MSRAFVSEEAAEAHAAVLPERPVSTQPNLVTPSGLQLIEDQVSRLQGLLGAASQDAVERPGLARDLRYWQARRASARLMEPPAGAPEEVAFGTTVVIRKANGEAGRYRIVGEDEADPAKGLLSWIAPLAQALLGARVGDLVEVADRPPVEILALK